MKPFYITTAIDYVNSLPHIGTAYEKIAADCIARSKRLLGYDVRFCMGTDEHSVNVKKKALESGLDPKAYCDRMRPVSPRSGRSSPSRTTISSGRPNPAMCSS